MLHAIVRNAVRAALVAAFVLGSAATASPLVTGNGFGFAVVAPDNGQATRFYPHPHSFVRADPAKPLSEGIETPNFIKSLGLGSGARKGAADYVADSHVIRLRRGGATGTFFMPFGLGRPALVIASSGPAWRVQWNYPVRSRTDIGQPRLMRFKGVDEPLLLVPLADIRKPYAGPLGGSAAWALIAL